MAAIPSDGWSSRRAGIVGDHVRAREFDAGPGGTLLCANDRIAFGVLAAAAEAGIAVGRTAGLRVAGRDDHPLSRYACPSLTTVAQDGEALASLGLRALMGQVSGEATAVAEHRIEARLIMRASA